jgi:hypothetical protein
MPELTWIGDRDIFKRYIYAQTLPTIINVLIQEFKSNPGGSIPDGALQEIIETADQITISAAEKSAARFFG